MQSHEWLATYSQRLRPPTPPDSGLRCVRGLADTAVAGVARGTVGPRTQCPHLPASPRDGGEAARPDAGAPR